MKKTVLKDDIKLIVITLGYGAGYIAPLFYAYIYTEKKLWKKII